ncbi:MAG TPA: TetR/AcrR family transcriptional regulator [Polyangiales bacterium]
MPRASNTKPRRPVAGPRAQPARAPARSAGRAYGGMSEEDRKRERRERFLTAGIVTFGRDGYRATTTRSLCAEAGLTQRYFYESFRDLEDLFLSVANLLGERVRKVLEETRFRANDDPQVALRTALTRYFELLKSDPGAARIMLLEAYTAAGPVGERALRFTEQLAELLRARIEEALPQLAQRGSASQLMAASLVGATHHLALHWMLRGYRDSVKSVVDTAVAVYLGAAFAVASQSQRG